MPKKNCYFCLQNIKEVNYKNTEILTRFISLSAKIRNRKKTGACASHQKKLARAIKRARHLGLIPVTIK